MSTDGVRAESLTNGQTETERAEAERVEAERRLRWKPMFRGPLRMRRVGEKETLILAFLCFLDMYTTLFWVVFGYADEANKLLSWTFEYHPLTFVIVKSATVVPTILLAPKLAQRHKNFTVWLLRFVIVGYVALYFRFAQF